MAVRPLPLPQSEPEAAGSESAHLRRQVERLEQRLHQRDEQRRAMLHIMSDLHTLNRRLSDQRKATLHILIDYEQDRRRMSAQTDKLANSRRALMHLLQDTHQTNLRLERSRKARLNILKDLHETTLDLQRREHELRDKQEQLVQAGKLATLGELTTGVAHELNNPLNNIGLFVGNALDQIDLGKLERTRLKRDLQAALQQVRKAGEIISHLRTFGRAAESTRESVSINHVIERALSLMREQLRLRQIEVTLDLSREDPVITGNLIQLEQVFINIITNARDALADAPHKRIRISTQVRGELVEIIVSDTGPGIPEGLEQRIFDPFFTTKEVGQGTGLGLSITYGIINDHDGSISVVKQPPGSGATFLVQLPLPSTGPSRGNLQA